MLSRYKVYADFFGINKRAAHYKIEKETLSGGDLKVFEKFIFLLSNEEIQQIVKFVEEESPELNIKLKRNKTTNKIKSSVKITHELVTVATIDYEIYQAYKEINKKPEQILLEYKNKLDFDKNRRKESLRFEEEEHECMASCEQLFEDQNDFQSFSAFKCHLEGDDDQAQEIENIYRSMPEPPKKVHIIPEYSHFLYAQETIDMHCYYSFEEKIDLIIDNTAEKNIVQYLLEDDYIFTKQLDTIAQMLKIDPKLVIHFGKEKFTQLFRKYKINNL